MHSNIFSQHMFKQVTYMIIKYVDSKYRHPITDNGNYED